MPLLRTLAFWTAAKALKVAAVARFSIDGSIQQTRIGNDRRIDRNVRSGGSCEKGVDPRREARIPEVSGLAITGVEKVPLFEVPAERLTFSPLPMPIGEPGV